MGTTPAAQNARLKVIYGGDWLIGRDETGWRAEHLENGTVLTAATAADLDAELLRQAEAFNGRRGQHKR